MGGGKKRDRVFVERSGYGKKGCESLFCQVAALRRLTKLL